MISWYRRSFIARIGENNADAKVAASGESGGRTAATSGVASQRAERQGIGWVADRWVSVGKVRCRTVWQVLLYPKEADFHLRQGVSLLRPADSNLTGLSTTSTGGEACLLQQRHTEVT